MFYLITQVDIYSLGIIAFEMWHPFETAMERYILLRALRERGELPTEWELEHSQVRCLPNCISGQEALALNRVHNPEPIPHW